MRHFLIRPTGPQELPLDKRVFFGRAEGNTIVVDDVRASRRHAELYWDGSAFVLMDLDSSNGTLVNDETVRTRILRDGDEIRIGLQVYRYRAVADPAELAPPQKQEEGARGMVTVEMPALASSSIPDTDFNGLLGSMGVADICQMLELGRRNGMLLLANEAREKAILYFKDGQISAAECGVAQGDSAALRALRYRRGTFAFRGRAPSVKPNVTQKTSALLLEAARQGDETDKFH